MRQHQQVFLLHFGLGQVYSERLDGPIESEVDGRNLHLY